LLTTPRVTAPGQVLYTLRASFPQHRSPIIIPNLHQSPHATYTFTVPFPLTFCASLLSCPHHGRIPFLFVTLFVYLCPPTPRSAIIPASLSSAMNSLRLVLVRVRFGRPLFCFPVWLGYCYGHITSKHHKHINIHSDTCWGCSTNLFTRKQENLLGSPKDRGRVSMCLG